MILTTQRTGSTWLRDMLNGHSDVEVYGELFHERGRGFPEPLRRGPTDIEFFESRVAATSGLRQVARVRAAFPYLDGLYNSRRETCAVGFKLMYSQVRLNPVICAWLATRRPKIVHLDREDLLDIVISRETVRVRGQAHAVQGEDVQAVAVRLEPQALLQSLRRIDRQRTLARRFLRTVRLDTLELRYEDLVADPRRVGDAFDFLGVGAGDGRPGSSMRKLNSSPKGDLVENWAEVAAALASTRYAAMVD